jgi:hypothetical protein
MDSKSIVCSFHRKDRMARAIHNNPVATLGEETITYSMMTWYLREARINPSVSTPLTDTISAHRDESDEALVRDLEELPCSFLQFESSLAPSISQSLWYPGGDLKNLTPVIFVELQTGILHRTNVHRSEMDQQIESS